MKQAPLKNAAADNRSGRGRVVSKIRRAWGESPFYQAQLNGPAPDRFAHMPTDPRKPDKSVAEMVARGKLAIGSELIDCEGELERIWDLAETGGPVFAFMQDFSWLRHMSALGEEARAPARSLLKSWLDRFEKWSPEAWAPYPTAERLTQLCCHGGLVLRGGDAMWRSRVLSSMARQTRHLGHAAHRAETGYERLMTAMGLALTGLCLPGCRSSADRGLELMRRELRLQIRPDGGHVSRNPSHQLSIVTRLWMVLTALDAARTPAPGFLKHVHARAVGFLDLFRAGDGKLCIFNGGYEDDGQALVSALKSVDAEATPAGFARHSGFQRLHAGRLMLVADTGVSVQTPAARVDNAYAGDGSFHLSSGRARIIVNCGNGAHLSSDWERALQKPAAHSSASSGAGGAETALFKNAEITHRRGEDAHGQLLEVERTTQVATQRLAHLRRFYLSARGDDMRGEDRLSGASEPFGNALILRFHLHPSVKASVARDGRSVLLALANHEGWRFRTNARDITLEKSIYCGEGGLPIASEQIVLTPRDLEPSRSGDMILKWGFRRIDKV